MPPGSAIISAMDHDQGGRMLSQMIGDACGQAPRSEAGAGSCRDVSFRVHLPEQEPIGGRPPAEREDSF